MQIFQSEAELLQALDKHDALVRRCVDGTIGFWEFCEEYADFYAFHALDGHESDEEERALLEKHDSRIEPHRVISYEILGKVCSDEDARRKIYREAGRFGSARAVELLSRVDFGP
ncbi:MAG: hypothetical protein HND52_20960 [Ignavibacteriae bacterium]|nr:hypothetical protein [Ignavibacteriota bacterium]NOH00443.1 hypothetical protein [Ignavibacteriota bacterium]